MIEYVASASVNKFVASTPVIEYVAPTPVITLLEPPVPVVHVVQGSTGADHREKPSSFVLSRLLNAPELLRVWKPFLCEK